MRIPIQYALSYPQHKAMAYDNALSFEELMTLTLEPMDMVRFPLLQVAYNVGIAKGIHPTVLNAANEVAVNRFLNKEIPFLAIEDIIVDALEYFTNEHVSSITTLMEVDQAVRAYAIGRNVLPAKGV